MIGSSKKKMLLNRRKETRIKIYPRVSASWPLNNWALKSTLCFSSLLHSATLRSIPHYSFTLQNSVKALEAIVFDTLMKLRSDPHV